MKTSLAVISLKSRDVEKSTHFYRDVLGLKMLHHHSTRPHFDLGGSFLVIVESDQKNHASIESNPFPVLAFSVDDLDTAIAELKSHRIEILPGIEADASSRWVMLHDPGGNLIEIVQFGT